MSSFDPTTFATLPVSEIDHNWTTDKDIHYLTDTSDATRHDRCQLDVFHPKGQTDTPVLVFIHGGGLSGGDHHGTPELYKHLGCVLVSPTYRLYPNAKYPEFIEDAAAALAWTKEHVAEFGGDPNKIFVSGHSAGGYLTTCLALMPEFLKKHNLTPFDFAGFIPISGSMVTHFAVQQERTGASSSIIIDEAAPLNHALKETPPLLILCGEPGMDFGSRPSDNRLMGHALRDAGNTAYEQYEVPNMDHGSILDAAYGYLLKFIRKHLTQDSASDLLSTP